MTEKKCCMCNCTCDIKNYSIFIISKYQIHQTELIFRRCFNCGIFSLRIGIKFLIQMRETSRNYSPSDCWTGTWKPQVQVPVCIRQKEFHCGASISFHMSASSIAILRIALFVCFTSRRKVFQTLLFFFNMEWTQISNSPTSVFFPELDFSFFN